MEPVKITQLEAENIKRIRAVQITPAEHGNQFLKFSI